MPKLVKFNDHGRRIGESHPRAVLIDHEVDMLIDMLAEREALIARMLASAATQAEIDRALREKCLSYRRLALKFDVHKSCIAKIAGGLRRCQSAAKVKACP